jgi:ABC-type glycerol-3-phosphate transport system permease component
MVFLLLFIEFWNDYQTPLLFMPTHPTLMFAIQQLSTSHKSVLNSTPMKMACCIIVVVPLTILFAVFSDKIMGNLTIGGVKG